MRSLLKAAAAMLITTARMLADALPSPLRTGWPKQASTPNTVRAEPKPAGSKLARMAREGRVGISKTR